jgi:hypothetical protein
VDPLGQDGVSGYTTIVDCCQLGVLRSLAAVPTRAAATEADVGKRRKYHDYPEGDTFYALVVETHGCIGEKFQRF